MLNPLYTVSIKLRNLFFWVPSYCVLDEEFGGLGLLLPILELPHILLIVLLLDVKPDLGAYLTLGAFVLVLEIGQELENLDGDDLLVLPDPGLPLELAHEGPHPKLNVQDFVPVGFLVVRGLLDDPLQPQGQAVVRGRLGAQALQQGHVQRSVGNRHYRG